MSSFNYMQKTIANEIQFSGVGLHSGKLIQVALRPAPVNTGILFVRSDKSDNAYIKLHPDHVLSTQLATTIGKGDVKISTIEHLMSALYAYNIDNLIVDVKGEEIPILDGSGQAYVYLLQKSGFVSLKRARRILHVTKPIIVEENGKKITINPIQESSRFWGLRVACDIEFNHPMIQKQRYEYQLTQESYETEIASARTYGFLKDVDYLKSIGLVKGGTLKNAIVLDEQKVLNPEGLRFKDEFVRHKILDLLGDFAVSGYAIVADVIASKSGHDLHKKAIVKLFENSDHYEILEFEGVETKQTLTYAERLHSAKILPARA